MRSKIHWIRLLRVYWYVYVIISSHLVAGESSTPLKDDAGLKYGLGFGITGNIL